LSDCNTNHDPGVQTVLTAKAIRTHVGHVAKYVERWAWEDFVLNRTAPTVVGLLSTGLFFHADLMRATDAPVRAGCLLQPPPGADNALTVCIDHSLRGQCVVLVDVASGNSRALARAREVVTGLGARKVKTVTLLHQPTDRRALEPDIFAVKLDPGLSLCGYGLGDNGCVNAPHITARTPHEGSA